MNYKEEMLNALTDVCKKARNEGYNDGCVETGKKYIDIVNNVRKEAYNKAWEAARKIVFQEVNLFAIFNVHWGDHSTDVLRDYSAQEAIQKIEKYEETQNEKCCITCGNHCFNETTEQYFCKVIKEGGICTNHDKWIPEKKQKQKCESCFTEKLTKEKWASAKDCKECKHFTDADEVQGYTPCGSCGTDLRNFEQKQTEKKCSCCENRHQGLACQHCKDFDKFVDEKVIRVGDEIVGISNGETLIVTRCGSKNMSGVGSDGKTWNGLTSNYWKKTGRHFHTIEYVLEELRKDKKGDEEK